MFSGGHDPSVSLLPDNKLAIIEGVQGGGGYEQNSKGWQSLPVSIKRESKYKPSVNHGTLQKFQLRWKQTLGPNIPSRRRPRQDPHIIVGILNIISCPTYVVAPLRGDEEAASDVFTWASNLMETDKSNHIIFMGPLLDNTRNTLIEQGISSLMSLYAGHVLYVCNKETELPSLNGLLLHAMPNTSKQVALGFVPEHENVYHRSSRNLDCLKVDTVRIPISKESEAESSRSVFNIEFDNPKTIKHREKDFDNKYISDDITFKAIPGWVTQIVYKDSTMDGGKLSMEEMMKASEAAKQNPPTLQNPYPSSPTPNRERPTFNSVAEVEPAQPSATPASTAAANSQASKPAVTPSTAATSSTADLPVESIETPPTPLTGPSQVKRHTPPQGRPPPPPSTNEGQPGKPTEVGEEEEGEYEEEGNEGYVGEENEVYNNETLNYNNSEYNTVTVDSIQYKIRKNAEADEEWKVGNFTPDEEQLLINQGYLYPKEIYPEILKVFRDQKCESEASTMLSKNCGLIRYLQANNLHNKIFKLNNKVQRRGNSRGSPEYEPEEYEPEENIPEETEYNSEDVSTETPMTTVTEPTAGKEPPVTVTAEPTAGKEHPVITSTEAPVTSTTEATADKESPVTAAKSRTLLPHQRSRSPSVNPQDSKKDATTNSEPVDIKSKGVTWRNESGKGSLENIREIERRPENPSKGGSRKLRQRKSKNKTVKLRFIY
jgi:hypothetical protein